MCRFHSLIVEAHQQLQQTRRLLLQRLWPGLPMGLRRNERWWLMGWQVRGSWPLRRLWEG